MKNSSFLYKLTGVFLCVNLAVVFYYLLQTAHPTADVRAYIAARTPTISISDFTPGQVEVIKYDDIGIIVWRRSQADQALVAAQNDPKDWRNDKSFILGHATPIFASDENLSLDGEWFFAVYPDMGLFMTRAGDFNGFFDGRLARHYDLSGRSRRGGGENLTIMSATRMADGETIQLNLGFVTQPRSQRP